MAVDNRLLRDLHRLFLGGKLREPKRWGDGPGFEARSSAVPLSAQWLSLGDAMPQDGADWTQARSWQAILNGIARVAGIIYGPRRLQIVFDRYDENYQYKPDRSVIVVSTEPALSPCPGYTLFHAADAMTGQVIHEAAHIRERQTEGTSFAEDPILSLLHHLVEDAIIDQIVALEYPGFEGYLLAYRHYYIDWKLRNNWGFQAEGRLKQLILAMRSTAPERVSRWSVRRAYLYLLYRLANARSVPELRRIDRAELAERLYGILYEARHAEHWSEPDVLSESFVLGKDGPAVRGENGNNRGGKPEPVTRSALEQLVAQDLERLLPDDDSDTQPDAESQPLQPSRKRRSRRKAPEWADDWCHREGSKRKTSGLSDEMRILLHRMTEEERERLDGADGECEVELARVPLHAQAAQRYRAAAHAVGPQVALLRRALAAVHVQPDREQFALHAGSDLDEEALYRAKFAADLFKRPSSYARGSAPLDMVLLIDASHSMSEPLSAGDIPKYVAAQRIAALFVEALEPLAAIRAWVFSYTSLGRKVEIRDLYSPDVKADKTRIGDLYPAHQTPEYQALRAVAGWIGTTARTGVRKVYLVLSDGCPSDDAYPRDRQIVELARLTRQLEVGGDAVIHIAIGPHGAADAMYAQRLDYSADGYAALIRRFGRLLEQWIN